MNDETIGEANNFKATTRVCPSSRRQSLRDRCLTVFLPIYIFMLPTKITTQPVQQSLTAAIAPTYTTDILNAYPGSTPKTIHSVPTNTPSASIYAFYQSYQSTTTPPAQQNLTAYYFSQDGAYTNQAQLGIVGARPAWGVSEPRSLTLALFPLLQNYYLVTLQVSPIDTGVTFTLTLSLTCTFAHNLNVTNPLSSPLNTYVVTSYLTTDNYVAAVIVDSALVTSSSLGEKVVRSTTQPPVGSTIAHNLFHSNEYYLTLLDSCIYSIRTDTLASTMIYTDASSTMLQMVQLGPPLLMPQ